MPISISQCVPPCLNSLILFVPFVRYVIRRQAVIYLLVRFFFSFILFIFFLFVVPLFLFRSVAGVIGKKYLIFGNNN